MNKTKLWIITATVLTVAGLILFAGALAASEGSFDVLNTNKYVTNTYEITEIFENISFETDTADITFALSDDGECKAVCFEKENLPYSVSVSDKTLTVKSAQKRWYDYIGINFSTPKITLYLPEAEYVKLTVKGSTGNVSVPDVFEFSAADISLSTGTVNYFANAESIKIKTSTGIIKAEGISARSIELGTSTGKIKVSNVNVEGVVNLTVSTGKTELENVKCHSLSSSGSTGCITLKNVIAEEALSIERSTGDINFDGCDASKIKVETDTGNVKGTLLSDKIFFTETDTGKVDVPKSTVGGECEIETDTGDIEISIKK